MSPRLHVGAALIASLLAGTLCQSAHAENDPALDRWTLATDHFHITYDTALEPVAVRLARLAEGIHERLRGPLGRSPDEITEILLTDYTDAANGSAIAVPYNQIQLYVTAPGDLSPLADYDDWYLSLLTHEYAHILHTDNISGVPSVLNALVGKRLAPNQLQPRWLLEGLAVVMESEHSTGGRLRSSLFDAYLRADVLDDNIAGLDAISNNAQRWPQGNLWYLYGSRFLHWIGEVYGHDVLRALATDYGATLIPLGINRAIRRETGRTYEQLYEGFKDHLRRTYGEEIHRVLGRGLREGRRVTFDGREAYYPQFVPKRASSKDAAGTQLAYFRSDFNARPGIYRLKLTNGDEAPQPELLARANAESPFSFAPNGDLVFSSVVPHKNIYFRSDLFRVPAGKRATDGREAWRRTLTTGLRATAPTVSPDGARIAFTVNGRGSTSLKLADVGPDGTLGTPRGVSIGAQPFDQFYTPVFSPDGTRLAFSRFSRGGFRDVAIVDLGNMHVTSVTHDRALDTNPTWSPDGTRLYFSSDRSGIFNIHEYRIADGSLRQVTNVKTLATMPAVSEDGNTLAYVGYTSAGFDLFVMPLEPSQFLEAVAPPSERPAPFEDPPPVRFTKRRYRPLETLRPRAYGIDFGQGNFGKTALALSVNGGDLAGHGAFGARIVADFGAPGPQGSLGYDYTRMPFDVGVQIGNRFSPRKGYRIGGTTPDYIERGYNLRTSLAYRRPGEFATQSFGISYTASLVDADLPVAGLTLDPLAEVTVLPRRGFLGTVHVGYGIGRVEGGLDTPGPARGFSLSLGFDASDRATGSTDSLYEANYGATAYVPMPFGKNSVLALRSAGGVSTGSFARRGLFYVGGYNLTDNSVLDTITAGTYSGAFVLRGYPAGAYTGSTYTLQTAELRFPLAVPDRGLSTLPLYLRRIDGNVYLDFGGAFDTLDTRAVELFSKGALVHSRQLHTGIGGELWLGTTLGYLLDVNMRLGYAFGFSPERIPGGQLYFLAASAF